MRIEERHPGFCERRYSSVRLSQFCGLISLGRRVIEVLPKLENEITAPEGRALLLRLMRLAGDVPRFLEPVVGHHTITAPLLEVFIGAFLDEVATLVRGGLPRRYQESHDDLTVLRGRLSAQRQFSTHFNRLDRISCEFDDLNHDSVWNRVVKEGLRIVAPWISSVTLHRRWLELRLAFEEVATVSCTTRDIDRLVFDRHADRYRGAIAWVRMLTSLLSPDLRSGDSAAPGLLLDANKLFERGVFRTMRRLAAGDREIEVRAQDSRLHLAESVAEPTHRCAQLFPDIVIERQGRVVAIGDTKWKRVDVHSRTKYLVPSSSDLYQMQAYAAAYGCEELALIYPWYEGLAGSRPTSLRLSALGNRHPVLHVLCVDVATDDLTLGSFGAGEVARLLGGIAEAPLPLASASAVALLSHTRSEMIHDPR